MHIRENGDRESGTLCGIGPGSQLVKQHQRLFVHFFQERNDIGHVGGEGTQALLDALFIPDIRVYLTENGKL